MKYGMEIRGFGHGKEQELLEGKEGCITG